MTSKTSGTTSRVETRVFVPATATRQDWTAYHAYIRKRAAEERPGEPILLDDVRERDMKIEWPLTRMHRVLALTDGELVGSFASWARRPGTLDYDQHARHIGAEAGVLKAWRRRGIGTALLQVLAGQMRNENRDLATIVARLGDGTAFLETIGAEQKQRDVSNRLDRSRIDDTQLDVWESRVAAENLAFELHAPRVPLDRYAELAAVLETLANSQPFGGIDRPPVRIQLDQIQAWYTDMDAHGGEHLMALIRHGDEIVAASEITWQSDFPDRAYQSLTGVQPAWRGRGLAKAVKARLLRLAMQRLPSITKIETVNASENDAMLAVNRQMGFVPYEEWTTYQISLDAIQRHVASI